MLQEVTLRKSTEVVDIESLGDYARQQAELGDEAGMAYYRKAGRALLKARENLQGETWTAYCKRKMNRSPVTCGRYIDAHLEEVEALENARKNRRRDIDAESLSSSLNELGVKNGYRPGGKGKAQPEWSGAVKTQADRARYEQVRKRVDTAAQERAAEKALQKRAFDIGFKVLAKELHPDRGGSKDAMARLTKVKRTTYRALGL